MEFNEVIKYLVDHLTIEIESECPLYDESASVKVLLKLGDVTISESSAPIHTD
jgi:hypothetical protein